ncbi:NmrA family NAD(P)-binding protein [Fluviicola chungangensis]|uniref:NAD-dependent dehydratase n=1 Tax=Fluviicola chungangensis TaxID=2597671 RepID=A0A556N734_9FLAO|nr:NmrA family NAD(P)-binding protein [Fluviicola chungangensis]TSJ47994.1 NAD-dependent dehydratase [Fluviicola chungangensis]
MKVTVTGSLGNISRILIEKLVSVGHEVRVVTSNAERAKEIEQLNATPLVGSIEDYEFVKNAFAGSEAVYLMIPPNFRTADLKQYIKTVGEQYANALKETGVKYAVNLSSIGSHLKNGLGPTGSNFYVEQKLNELQKVNVLHLRPGMFLTNFYGAIPMIKHQNMLGNNFGGTINLPLTHPKDIAEVAFKALNDLSISDKQIQYIVSDEKNGFEVAEILSNAVGKSGVNWIEFSDEQLLGALVQSGFSEQMAKVYMVEIGVALKDGSFMEDYNRNKSQSVGGTTLENFAKEFAMAYQIL